jgi:type VI protein secretion system component Hcp
MDGAEVYLLMIRKSGLPILGEAMAPPFYQQVEVLDWNWKIVNQEEVDRRAVEDAQTEILAKSKKELKLELAVLRQDLEDAAVVQAEKTKEDIDVAGDEIKELVKKTDSKNPGSIRATLLEIDRIQRETGKNAAERNLKGARAAMAKYEKDKKEKELGNLEFSFSKRVDFASTQMLNCMKAGEILPQVIITIFHRSVSAPLTIIVTAKNLRFLKYDLSVEVDDTMADMKEDWEAEFSEIAFSYTNIRGVDQQKGRLGVDALAGAKLALAAKNTTSLFVMKSRE